MFFYNVVNSEFSTENILTLKYKFSLRQFMAYKENVLRRELVKAANLIDEKRKRDEKR